MAPEVKAYAGPQSYRNWHAHNAGARLFHTPEVPLYSDARGTGEVSDGLGRTCCTTRSPSTSAIPQSCWSSGCTSITRRPDDARNGHDQVFHHTGWDALIETVPGNPCTTIGGVWSREDTPFPLNTFEYITRGALLHWWRALAARGTASARAGAGLVVPT